ncbi:hypothetical protein VUR80DRAFT_7662 [Thermomyces stellatus]
MHRSPVAARVRLGDLGGVRELRITGALSAVVRPVITLWQLPPLLTLEAVSAAILLVLQNRDLGSTLRISSSIAAYLGKTGRRELSTKTEGSDAPNPHKLKASLRKPSPLNQPRLETCFILGQLSSSHTTITGIKDAGFDFRTASVIPSARVPPLMQVLAGDPKLTFQIIPKTTRPPSRQLK